MEPSRLPTLLGRRVRELRLAKGLTQWHMAERGFSYKYYQKIEAGRVNLTLKSLAKLAAALGVEVSDLFRFPLPQGKVAAEANRVAALVTWLINAAEEEDLRKIRVFITEVLGWKGHR
jgi:transcriptional regulator with XRE-family HTH domain